MASRSQDTPPPRRSRTLSLERRGLGPTRERAPTRVAFIGRSLVSAYWNGAATYYRGLLKALAGEGLQITFFEPDDEGRRAHRDIADPPWARVRVYPPTEAGARWVLSEARAADVVIKASGVGAHDELLEREALSLRAPGRLVIFWDVDAPATLDRLRADPFDPFRALVPRFDAIFTYGGGPPVISAYVDLGASFCLPVYNALDPETHHPEPRDLRYGCAMAFLGDRRPDREARVEEFFFSVARRRPQWRFLLGGSGWDGGALPGNISRLGHVYTRDHNLLNSSALAVLNVHRDGMARYGYSPATRLFEAAGAASCVVTDTSVGLDTFLEPGREVLVARDGAEVVALLDDLSVPRAVEIGRAARERVLAQHTYRHRAATVLRVLSLLRERRGNVIPWRSPPPEAQGLSDGPA
jgi:spore maturation protein CgeB